MSALNVELVLLTAAFDKRTRLISANTPIENGYESRVRALSIAKNAQEAWAVYVDAVCQDHLPSEGESAAEAQQECHIRHVASRIDELG